MRHDYDAVRYAGDTARQLSCLNDDAVRDDNWSTDVDPPPHDKMSHSPGSTVVDETDL